IRDLIVTGVQTCALPILQCCECHDHKYDPFTTKDFYRCEALFADIKEQGFYGGGGGNDWGPRVRLPNDAQQKLLSHVDAEIAGRSEERRVGKRVERGARR